MNESKARSSNSHSILYFPTESSAQAENNFGQFSHFTVPQMALETINVSSTNDSFDQSQTPPGPEPWTWFKFLIEIICFTCGLIGILGNSLVVTVYFRKTRRKATEILILCLSCLDLVYCICNNVIQVLIIMMGFYPPSVLVQDIIEFILNFLFTSLPYMSWLMILNITCNRYIAVCHPFKYSQIYTLNFAKNAVLAILLFSVVIAVPFFFKAWMSSGQIEILLQAYQGMRAFLVAVVCSSMLIMYSR